LSNSYFGGTYDRPLDIRNIDLSGCDLTNVTFIFCDAREANLANAKCYGVYCRHSRWEGATLPAETGFLQHEWVAEIIRAATAAQDTTQVQNHFGAVADFVLQSYSPVHSWNTSWANFLDVASSEEFKPAYRALFAPYPFLARRFEMLVEKFDVSIR